MVEFKNIKDLKKALDKQCYYLVEKAAEKVRKKIEDGIKEYYSEFHPEIYTRTWNLLNSVIKSDPVKTKDGYKVDVYIDTSKAYSPDDHLNRSSWKGKPWTIENTMYFANKGYHGRHDRGYPKLWEDRILPEVTDEDIINGFISFMDAKGIKLTVRERQDK